MFDFAALQRGKPLILDDRFRVRLLNKDAIPLIYDITGLAENIVLIDLPQAEGIEAKILEAQKEIHSLTLQKTGAAIGGEDKENIPEGCVKVGENLQVTFLSIEKLDKLAAANQIRMEENAFEIASLERFAEFDLHLVPQVEARMLLNRLSSTPDIHKCLPFEFSTIVFSEGSRRQNMLFIGINHTSKQKITFKGTYLGDFSSSINRLDYLSSSTNRFSLIDGKCRCRFDLLKENMVFEKSGNFIPAEFIIEAEWPMEKQILQKHNSEKMQYIYLMKPPDYADASILFKPGWKDARIALNDRIGELRHLAELATHLKEGSTPWSGQNECTNQPDVIDALKQLIANAKIKLEAQPVFPFDFTDRLWDVLKLAKSIATLQRAFQLIYDELQTGEFQVLVESNKVSSLAKMLRMRNPNEIIFSRLEPMICLQFLVEIGLDRFNEELAYRFLENHFVTNSVDLKPFFLPSFQPLEKRIEQLMPLHLALQSMIMIDQYVCVVQHEKANIAKRLLAHFTKLELTEAFEKVFVYKTKMENIRREKIGESLIDWILERNYQKLLASGTKNGSFSTAVHISKNFGIKYLERFPADVNATMIKQEVGSPNPDNTNTTITKVDNIEEEEDKKEENKKLMQFECVYITTDRQPEGLFV